MEDLLLPLFPLEVVLLPEEPLPLHIFEDRYKRMINDCLKAKAKEKGQQEFGVIFVKHELLAIRNEAERLHQVTDVIEVLFPQIEMVQKTRSKAGGNGNARIQS